MSNSIMPSPEVQKLKDDCSLLRDELAALLSEREHLVNTVAPNILAAYATTIGVKEYEALSLNVEVRKLKSTIEKLQAMENHGKKPNLEQIEAAVEDELKEWQEKVDKMVVDIQESQERLKNQMTSEDSAELQKLYRTLVKKLHPDLNPSLSDKQKLLWDKVQQAYATGDLQEMKALALMADDIPEDLTSSNQIETLQERREQLKSQADDLMQQIADLKANPPLAMAEKLDDPDWVKDQTDECEKRIEKLAVERSALEEWLSVWKGKK